jgi:4-amino-4-deoxy-L-arabinose transferase-like glycosyltransferase
MKIKKTVMILIIIFALSLFLRLYKIFEIPYNQKGEFYDDLLLEVNAAKNIIDTSEIKFLYGEYMTNLYIIFILPFYLLWNSLITFKIVTAVIDSITSILLFILVKNVYDNKTAFISAFLYSISPFIINFSRLGIDVNMLPFINVLSLLYLFKWLKLKQIKYLYLLSLFLSVGIAFHPSFIYITIAIFTFLLINKSYKKINYKQFFILILIFIVGLSLYFLGFIKGEANPLKYISENIVITQQGQNNLLILENLATRLTQSSHILEIIMTYPIFNFNSLFKQITFWFFLLSSGFLLSRHFYRKSKFNPDIILLTIFIFTILFSIFSTTKLAYAHLGYLAIIQIIIISNFLSSILNEQKYLSIFIIIILVSFYFYVLYSYFNQYVGEEFGYKALCKYITETKPKLVVTQTFHTFVILSSCYNNSIMFEPDFQKQLKNKNEIKFDPVTYITDDAGISENITKEFNTTFIKSIYRSYDDKINDVYRLIP